MMKQNYLRIITDTFPHYLNRKKSVTILKANGMQILAIWSVLLVVFFLFSTLETVQMYRTHLREKESAVHEYEYWRRVMQNHPNYPDGYYKFAVYAYMIGKKNEAIASLQSAIYIDPSFEAAKRLEKQIEGE